jgi:DNA-binding GntR family transcriptional regulator
MDLTIDRSSPVPLYYQLSQALEAAIASGELKPGDRIDTEMEIAEAQGLSRPTVRQAIQELVRKGLLVRRRGVGTQVVHSQVRRPLELTSLYDDLSRAGHRPTTSVLDMDIRPAAAEVAAALGIDEDSPVLYLRRLRRDAGAPLAVMQNWLPRGLIDPDTADLEHSGLYDVLRRSGVHMKVANQRIGARTASATEVRLLGIKSGAALLTMARKSYDDTGRAVEYASHSYRADTYSFETTLVGR